MYRVLVNGRNFLVEFDGSLQKSGFFATHFVDVSEKDVAESTAISNIRADPDLLAITRNESNDPPLLFIEELELVDHALPVTGKLGFSWYRE